MTVKYSSQSLKFCITGIFGFISIVLSLSLWIDICFWEQVFLKAMAETGQIKLYGDHPTMTETSLYRARRHIYKEER